MDKKTDNKRTLQRKQPYAYLKVYDREESREIGRVVDITSAGMKMVSSNPISTNREYQLRITLPGSYGLSRNVDFDATSLWTGRDVNPSFHDTGFVISKIAPIDVTRLEILMRQSSFDR